MDFKFVLGLWEGKKRLRLKKKYFEDRTDVKMVKPRLGFEFDLIQCRFSDWGIL